jgi:hypothetical protein
MLRILVFDPLRLWQAIDKALLSPFGIGRRVA